MRILVLGHGKTGKLVAEVASERGHGVNVLDARENQNAAALTPAFLAGFDAVIDFTTPEAVIPNMRACLFSGARMVVGTTGWYSKLKDMRDLAERKDAGLLYGSNFSIGVQVMHQLAEQMGAALSGAGYDFAMSETHHITKMDKPSGTALTLVDAVVQGSSSAGKTGIAKEHIPIEAIRDGDAPGLHVLTATSGADRLTLTHEAFSRRGFAEGAVRAAEWLATRKGCYDFREVFTKL
ncbi:4-hydroxy-tetrahydrodipicolinate reductase [Granulicella sibirica]|uniref:4-hydroxy-tetrahydrodipicolinate reductase n=1 Tax=Granulicella sibirica TaxID=2479048 RepID=A0A4Q0T3L1_9BACT|nr:4-hydroxy-tetrahydrodipicolinate reductase [Granulicella sibirica]RXH57512.1 4-hydroxy-tetrahydrodipicolinate reductase [Granulicella sibirica]